MQKETLKRYHSLTLFDCGKRIMEKEGKFPLTNKWNKPVHITLRDTVVHPDGWAGTKLSMDYTDFSESTVLTFAFGKPFANDISDTATVFLKITRNNIILGDSEYEWHIDCSGTIDIAISDNKISVCSNSFNINAETLSGYLDIYPENGSVIMTGFCAETKNTPYTDDEHTKKAYCMASFTA